MRISDWSSDVCSSDLALVTVEREGVLASYVTEISGKDPVIEVKMPGSYAPDVYVSVLAVRGRVDGFWSWLSHPAYKWGLPFGPPVATQPTATVDLAKPADRQIGRAHVWTPVTNAHLVCLL